MDDEPFLVHPYDGGAKGLRANPAPGRGHGAGAQTASAEELARARAPTRRPTDVQRPLSTAFSRRQKTRTPVETSLARYTEPSTTTGPAWNPSPRSIS